MFFWFIWFSTINYYCLYFILKDGFMLDKYSETQKVFFDYFKNVSANGHLSHAYLIEANGVSYASGVVYDLAKFFLCDGKYDEKICDLVDKGNCPNLRVIGNDGKTKKNDIVSLKTDFSMKSVDNRKLVYILFDVENFNKNTSNSLLKFLEEPDDNVIAILLCDNAMNVLPTIVSRCQTIRLINDDNYYESVFTSLYNESDGNYSDFVYEKVNNFFEIYLNIEKYGSSIIASSDYYNIKDNMKEFLVFGYYLYYDVLNYIIGRKVRCSQYDIDIKNISEKNSIHDIIIKMDILNRFIFDFNYNVNVNLFLDNFAICMGSV